MSEIEYRLVIKRDEDGIVSTEVEPLGTVSPDEADTERRKRTGPGAKVVIEWRSVGPWQLHREDPKRA